MTASRMRIVLSALALAGATLLVAGCTATPEAPAPTSKDGGAATTAPDDDVIGGDVEAAWLDGGRAIGVVTWGSSTCVPIVDDVSADGQMISVALSDGDENQPCTNDLVPRATFVAVPEGVDVTQDVELAIAYGTGTEDADLDGLAEAPAGMSENAPSAGWFADDGIVLLTYGSSTCQPLIEDIEQSDAGATVTFKTTDRPCTMDFVPRLTTITLPMEHDDGPFELTLVGDNLDATVAVLD
ncbi:hypothetical protein [Microbacterium esteraromaticum]|uniref:hypothetical protein n=1 Tax=Microbacterium esteraromaticum TaxID=57043 RepID=UPI001C977758|nr:hypothetical protein [Microbacterium esteraromaticum]MBY6060085.1 hypothetical protein [Microbacterium esteraromaticum]